MKMLSGKKIRGARWVGVGLMVAAAGCSPHKEPAAEAPMPQERFDMAAVDSMLDAQARTGVVRQHTLYAYHFNDDGARLTELGSENLDVLIEHWKKNGLGDLNVRKGNASDALYAARLKYIQERIQFAGLDSRKLHIADGVAGGEAMSSNNVARALDREAKKTVWSPGEGGSDTSSGQSSNNNMNQGTNAGSNSGGSK